MDYTALSDSDREQMLNVIGVRSIDELFADIPEQIRLNAKLNLPEGLSDIEVENHLRILASKNVVLKSFLGAGIYRHYIPAVVDEIARRGEFFTAYTPYQPEVSQGTLTAIFEYQTMIARLTGLDIANASMYDGATATAESLLLALRGKECGNVVISETLHPHYREVVRTYMRAAGVEVRTCSMQEGKTDYARMASLIDSNTAAVAIQSPNFFGLIEDVSTCADIAHKENAKLVQVIAEPLSLGILKRPDALGADIACGEAQSFGNYVGFGGPLLGFIATKEEFVRKMPGRLVGKSVDEEGKEAYVLTLQTREQHIRRERATSNICSNEGLCALRAVIYLSLLGNNIRRLARLNHQLAAYLKHKLIKKGFVAPFAAPFFNEFVVCMHGIEKVCERLSGEGYELGFLLEPYYPSMRDCVLVCATEMNSPAEIDALIAALEGVM